nr:MAG TPA_asm: hypothetical protein [Caudoviricetes sp.]
MRSTGDFYFFAYFSLYSFHDCMACFGSQSGQYF